MALNKDDKKYIKSTVSGAVNNLARIVAKGFDGVDKRFELIDKRFELIDKRFEQIERQIASINMELRHMNARLGALETDVSEIRKHFVYRDEFEDALARILLLEKKVGVRSGK